MPDKAKKKTKPKTKSPEQKADGATAFAVAGGILLLFAIAGAITSRIK